MIWANIFIKHLWISLYRDVLKLSIEDQGLWKSARTMKRQIVTETKVWELVDLPKGRHTIKGRWFLLLETDDCKIARLVTHQYTFTQIFGIDYEETFFPVTSHETIRLLLSLAMLHVWEIEALDVKTAYQIGRAHV